MYINGVLNGCISVKVAPVSIAEMRAIQSDVHKTAEDITNEGNGQVARVITEGATQVTAVIDEGDTQEARLVAISDEAYLDSREAEASAMTSDSFATEPLNVYVKIYYYDEPTDTILYNNTDEYSAAHYAQKSAIAAAGLSLQGTWDAIDCSLPPTPPLHPIGESADGALYIVTSSTGDTTLCPTMSTGDWLVWYGDDPATDLVVEGQWELINWTFDWSAITGVPENVSNALSRIGGQMTGQIKGIAPVAVDDLTR